MNLSGRSCGATNLRNRGPATEQNTDCGSLCRGPVADFARWAVGFMLLVLLSLGGWAGQIAARADEELDYGLETHRLAAIEISGNEAFTSAELKNLLRIQEATWSRPLHIPRYQPHLVATQVRLLRAFYRNRGFHQVEARIDSISTIVGEGDVLHISIDEGLRTFIRQV